MADPNVTVKQESENGALVAALEKYGVVDILTLTGIEEGQRVQVAAVSDGFRRSLISVKGLLGEYRTAPERREGTATLTTLDSFCSYVKRFADEHSVIFADVENRDDAKLVAIIDYNEKKFGGAPRFGKHRAVYKFPLSEEWKAWMAVNGKELPQGKFAQHIEDRILDVQAPSEAGDMVKAFAINLGGDLATMQRLQELANGLSINVDIAVINATNLSSGEGQISFQETHSDGRGGKLNVPKGFAIAIPVFRNGAFYSMPVRLRYRRHENKILWTSLLYRDDRVWDDAVKIACDTAHAETGLDLLYGRPEQ